VKRFIIAFALIAGCALVPSIARADCGFHQIQVDAPKILAFEALPLTYENTTDLKAPRRNISVLAPEECPDDTVAKQVATDIVYPLWMDGIRAQNDLARYRFILAGRVQGESPQCKALYRDRLRYNALMVWGFVGAKWFSSPYLTSAEKRARLHALAAAPYFESHVVPMWKSLAAQLGLVLPPIEKRNDAEITRLDKKIDSEHAHLPDGVSCDEFLTSSLF
jgi:hypothetical protein